MQEKRRKRESYEVTKNAFYYKFFLLTRIGDFSAFRCFRNFVTLLTRALAPARLERVFNDLRARACFTYTRTALIVKLLVRFCRSRFMVVLPLYPYSIVQTGSPRGRLQRRYEPVAPEPRGVERAISNAACSRGGA